MVIRRLFAHSKKGTPQNDWQPLEKHLENVAVISEKFAEEFHSADWGWNAGWLHDLGKAVGEFQAYLLRENDLDDSEYDVTGYGRINHSSAGASFAKEIYEDDLGVTIAYLVAGHHAGLPDFFNGLASLQSRLEDGNKNLEKIRAVAKTYEKKLRRKITPPNYLVPDTYHLWVRMLFSCLVDADFLDTENFIDPLQSDERGGYKSLCELKPVFDKHLKKKAAESEINPVNNTRQEILEACRMAAQHDAGLFSLTVPTGGGKTLSGMAFAIDHAMKHKKQRIIYVIPYTSIIEQTSAILKSILGDDNVIEHHSNLDPDKETLRSKLATENWDAPVIVTTNVQFFESLYSAKPGRCRKLHNIINSVVILDEAQLIPPNLLDPCVKVIRQLTDNFRVTVLITTATQPPLPKLAPEEIITDPPALYRKLKRTDIIIPDNLNTVFEWPEIATQLKQHDKVLCIVNSRRDCYDLYKLMPPGTYHLSALMCGSHRSVIIDQIKKRLKADKVLRVISTQLVEAGVDIDFPVVYRAFAGLGSIAQAAGRCNREGVLNLAGKLGKVYVFIPPRQTPLGMMRKAEDTTRELCELPDFNPQHPDEFTRFFNLYYSKINDTGKTFDEWLVRDAPKIQLRTAGNEFKFIDDMTQATVFVAYGNGVKWIDLLRKKGPKRRIMRKLQRFTVNLSKNDFLRFKKDGLVNEIWPGYSGWYGRYDYSHGLDLFGGYWEPEDLLI